MFSDDATKINLKKKSKENIIRDFGQDEGIGEHGLPPVQP